MSDPLPSLLILGAGAGPAMALRELLSAEARHGVIAASRRPIPLLPGETARIGEDYGDVAMDGVDIVVNFVGQVSGRDRALSHRLNVEVPLAAARRAKAAGAAMFVHLSSLSVYGDAKDVEPDTPTAPSSLYGRTKLQGDEALIALADGGFTVAVVRVPAIYGPGLDGKLKDLARLLASTRIFAAPRADGPRSTLHSRHLALAVVDVIDRRAGGIRFAADPWAFSLVLLADAVSTRVGGKVRMIRAPSGIFAPVSVAAPRLYRSLYGRSLIDPAYVVIAKDRDYLVPATALGDLID